MGTIKKEFVCSTILGDYYSWNIYKITDAHKQIWYIAEPVNHGATRLGDTLEEVKAKLEADVPILNRFLQKTR